jgi:succinate dehydrogenase hydrophobic membrane anchor protein
MATQVSADTDLETSEKVRARAQRYTVARNATLPWFLQRLTSVLLILTLFIHIWVLHFASVGAVIDYTTVSARLATAFYILVDSSLLALVLYHGLNGTRNVVLDYVHSQRAQSAVTWVLTIVGVAAFVYGVYGIVPFITGQPLFFH